MQSTAIMPRSWKQPLFTIGQRTQQGRIIGINYSTQKQSEGWYYTILIDESSGQVVQLPETQVRLLSKQEIEAKILAEIDLHLARLTILQQELDADLEIRTPFGTVSAPLSQTPRSSNGTSRLSQPKKKVSA
ncbi:hypothetical protein [Nostoc sp. MG11]|uniref:hypothetical protein n=1 Tax=Nostoc sp. MG11 TaxID=2721166 RepID=UPI001865AFC1|nr:hypothetical protein [Nostoc sp. MG11]